MEDLIPPVIDILILVTAALLSAAAGAWYARADKRKNRAADICFGSVLLALEMLYNGMLVFTGNMSVYMLPLHLCALSVFVCVIYLYTGTTWMGQFMYYLGAPGAVCALLFPDWTAYPLLNFYSLSSFIIHSMLAACCWVHLRAGRIRPDFKGLLKSLAFLVILAVPVYIFNLRFGTNYMFLAAPSANSPLESVASVTGPSLYLAGFFVLLVLVEMVLYLPWGIAGMIRNRSANK